MRTVAQPAPPIGTHLVVGGSRLFVDKRGSSDPTVVFLPGAGLSGLDYLHLHERVAQSHSSLLYDRAGTGWSERVRLPRTAAQVTDELHQLLAATDSVPAVLVGHSLGGLYARHYATRFPAEVAALLLLDPAHEDYDASMPAELTEMRSGARVYDLMNAVLGLALKTVPTKALLQTLPPVRRYQRLYRELFEHELSDWPAGIREALVDRHVSLEWLAVGLQESRKLDDLYGEVREAGPMPDVPLIIFSSTGTDGFRDAVSSGESAELVEAEVAAKLRLYRRVAAGSSHGEVCTVDSGHVTLPFRQAGAIIEALEDLLAR